MKKIPKFEHRGLLGNGKVPTDWSRVHEMNKVIAEVGGTLHFIVETYKDGWSAQCSEISGINTGGSKTDPTSEEIELNIREAIHSAFNISSKIPSKNIINNEVLPSFAAIINV